MDLLFWTAVVAVAAFLIQIFRLIRADGDLSLMWAEAFGASPASALQGKVVWLTGASGGIGEQLAYQLAECGCRLVLSSRKEDELERVKKTCLERSNLSSADVLVLPLDLLDVDSHKECLQSVLRHFGKVDVLLNNGGRSQRSLFLDTSLAVIRSLMELNYIGTVSLTLLVLREMVQCGHGTVVVVNSIAGICGVPLASGYCASKHALMGLCDSLQIELGRQPGIKILSVCPGPVQSNIVKNAYAEELGKPATHSKNEEHKMATTRCARLILIAMANNLLETWICSQPLLLYPYMLQYLPSLCRAISLMFGQRRIDNFRSGLDADDSFMRSTCKTKST
uniref:dehydrogenase/reductase SDR family member 7 isoform X1 n=2 Tax=Myxine glutinosa TaxID=7769 RepID=UPI00358DFD49